jgi:hypothetical protein
MFSSYAFFFFTSTEGAIPPKRDRLSYCFSYLHLEHLKLVESHLERVLASAGFARCIYCLFFDPFQESTQKIIVIVFFLLFLLLFFGAGALLLISFLS